MFKYMKNGCQPDEANVKITKGSGISKVLNVDSPNGALSNSNAFEDKICDALEFIKMISNFGKPKMEGGSLGVPSKTPFGKPFKIGFF